MLFRTEGLRVAVVGPGDKVKLAPIQVGQDDGRMVEVTEGLSQDEEIIQNPPDSIVDGELVHTVRPEKQNQQGPGGSGQQGGQK
jgi:hypothetical protein